MRRQTLRVKPGQRSSTINIGIRNRIVGLYLDGGSGYPKVAERLLSRLQIESNFATSRSWAIAIFVFLSLVLCSAAPPEASAMRIWFHRGSAGTTHVRAGRRRGRGGGQGVP